MKSSFVLFGLLAATAMLAGCATAPTTDASRDALAEQGKATLATMRAATPSIDDAVNAAYAYAVFPNVGKGAFIVGGGYGKGVVYEQGRLIGYADISQATVGLQAGGATFSELILFKDKEALNKFKNNQTAFTADASAVAVQPGVAVAARYSNGVAVFTHAKGGLMVAAAIGSQKFNFVPVTEYQNGQQSQQQEQQEQPATMPSNP